MTPREALHCACKGIFDACRLVIYLGVVCSCSYLSWLAGQDHAKAEMFEAQFKQFQEIAETIEKPKVPRRP